MHKTNLSFFFVLCS